MAAPALAVNRVVVSETELPLPVDTIAEPGTWRAEGGELRAIDRSAAHYGEGQWVTMIVGCPFVSADDWRIVNIPGIGGLELAQFWGSQNLHMVLYDGDAGDRRELCHIDLSSTRGPAPESPRAGAPCAALAARATEEVEDAVVDRADATAEGAEAPPKGGPASLGSTTPPDASVNLGSTASPGLEDGSRSAAVVVAEDGSGSADGCPGGPEADLADVEEATDTLGCLHRLLTSRGTVKGQAGLWELTGCLPMRPSGCVIVGTS